MRPLSPLALALLTLASAAPAFAQESRAPRDLPQHPAAHRPTVMATKGMVTGGHPFASISSMRILLQGGNAFDAAVTEHSILGMVKVSSTGPGGNGFATVFHKASGKVYNISMAGAAPKALPAAKMTPTTLSEGPEAGMVGGMVGGWITMLDRFGTMSLAQVLQPAIEYAENGIPMDAAIARAIEGRKAFFEKYPSSARVFLPGGRVPKAGELFKWPDYAHTLRRLVDAEQNALKQGRSRHEALQAAFDLYYKGDIAREMAKFYQDNGGYLTYEDFAAYQPLWTEPVHTTYRGYDVYSSPSTSRGGIEMMMQLNLVEAYDLKKMGHNSPSALHLMAQAIEVAKADVYKYVADPNFTKMPLAGMLSKEYAATRRSLINMSAAIKYPEPGDPTQFTRTSSGARANVPHEGPQFPEQTVDEGTDSYSIIDPQGNVVALTPTHGGSFGTSVIIGNTGFLSNNGLRLGSTSPYPDNVNYPRGGQVPILNNSPVIVMKDGQFYFSLGTPGGETIGQAQFVVLLNLLDFGMGMQEAIEAPRFNLSAEPNFYKPGAEVTMNLENRVSPETVAALRALGDKVTLTAGYAGGNMQGIMLDPVTKTLSAGADPRNTGYAIGW